MQVGTGWTDCGVAEKKQIWHFVTMKDGGCMTVAQMRWLLWSVSQELVSSNAYIQWLVSCSGLIKVYVP